MWRLKFLETRVVSSRSCSISDSSSRLRWSSHAHLQLAQRNRLVQEFVGAAVQRGHARFEVVLRRQHQYGQVLVVVANVVEHLDAAHVGQVEVENEQVRSGAGGVLQRFAPGGGGTHLVAMAAQ
jgi:hypothetical protein